MIRLFHMPTTRSLRVIWLMEEMGIAYELVPVSLGPHGLEHPDFARYNPLNTVPTLVDGDVVMTESGAMVSYLMAKYGPTELALAADHPDYPAYLDWQWFCEASLAQHIVTYRLHTEFLPPDHRSEMARDQASKDIQKRLQEAERRFGTQSWAVADQVTAADIFLGHACHAVVGLREGPALPQNLQRYYQRLMDRPAFARAIRC